MRAVIVPSNKLPIDAENSDLQVADRDDLSALHGDIFGARY